MDLKEEDFKILLSRNYQRSEGH